MLLGALFVRKAAFRAADKEKRGSRTRVAAAEDAGAVAKPPPRPSMVRKGSDASLSVHPLISSWAVGAAEDEKADEGLAE
jgi:hypothetical protein